MTSVNLEKHQIWCSLANKKLQSIYNQLCEFESILCEEQGDGSNLFELLETINEIQQHHQSVIENIKSRKDCLSDKCNDLEMQMELLNKSIKLLKLETNWKDSDDNEGNMKENL